MQDNAARAIEEAIRLSTVGVVHGSGDVKWKRLGTGTLVHWRGRFFVLTAEHVGVGKTDAADLRFFLPEEAPARLVDRAGILGLDGAPAAELHPFSELKICRIAFDRRLDLAAIEIDETLDGKHPAARFLDLAPGGTTPAVGHTVACTGFPADITRFTEANHGVVFNYVQWTEVVDTPTGVDEVDPALHALTAYADEEPAHPAGMSGGGMWLHRKAEGIWHPNIDLAAVTISYFPPTRQLKGVRREAIEGFLTTYFGG
jgi:hypothetical protein